MIGNHFDLLHVERNCSALFNELLDARLAAGTGAQPAGQISGRLEERKAPEEHSASDREVLTL